jgi:Fe2+ transport system protein FeoA
MTEEKIDLLSTLSVGDRGRVSSMNLPGEQRQRLLEMGLTVGTEFQVVRFAPLGDPLEIKVRGYHLSLRKCDAAGVRVVRL